MRILALSSIRSDYDLMSKLYREISADDRFEFGIIVAGVHNSEFHGITSKYIEKDQLNIISKIMNFENVDGYTDQLISAAKILDSISRTLNEFKPDLVLVVGDREDALMLAIASTYSRIPFIHFYGGDHAEDGHVDNQVRHAISKLATFHFVSNKFHEERLLCLGEEKERIKVVGSLAIDNFVEEPTIQRDILFRKMFNDRLDANDRIALVIYHPIVSEVKVFLSEIDAIIDTLNNFGLKVVVGKSNNDPSFAKIDSYFKGRSKSGDIYLIDSLERSDFINLFRNLEVLVGNSSAGILESATVGIPVINLGIRQRNRTANSNVLFSKIDSNEFRNCLETALSDGFKSEIAGIENIYGNGASAAKAIIEMINIDLPGLLVKSKDPSKVNRFKETDDSSTRFQ